MKDPEREFVVHEVVGDDPVHTHFCPDGDGHQWECNSPYCEVLKTACPVHGGDAPIRRGREFWRK